MGRGNPSDVVYPCVLSSVDAHACGAVRCLKRKRRVESHCFRAADLELDTACNVDVWRETRPTPREWQLTICPYPEVVSSTGSADGWQSVVSVSCGVGCGCEGFCDEAARVRSLM